MKNMTGKCEYCGAETGVIAYTQEEANYLATEQCDCCERMIAQKKTILREKIEELTGENCEEVGFRPVDADIKKVIKNIGDMIIDGRIQNVTVKVDGTAINIKGGAKVKVIRKYTHEQAEEIE